MFSQGQIIFGVYFVVFSMLLVLCIEKTFHYTKYYKNSHLVLIAFISFIGLIALIKFLLNNLNLKT